MTEPTSHVRLVGASLRTGPDDREIAHHDQGLWHLDGKTFTAIRLHASAPIRVEIVGSNARAETLGTYESVGLIDGAVRHGPRLGALLARLDEDTHAWLVYPGRKMCSILVLSTSEQPA